METFHACTAGLAGARVSGPLQFYPGEALIVAAILAITPAC
jgi:hypothetical protein